MKNGNSGLYFVEKLTPKATSNYSLLDEIDPSWSDQNSSSAINYLDGNQPEKRQQVFRGEPNSKFSHD